MECMEARALKSSYSSELGITMKTSNNPQGATAPTLDDYWCVAALPTEDFSIDEFFNLPNDDNNNTNTSSNNKEDEDDDEEEEKYSNSPPSPSSHSVFDDSLLSNHLSIPDDDMQELELWSHLMDDSVPEPNLACPKSIMEAHAKKTGFTFVNRIEPGSVNQRLVRASFIPTAFPVKPRSKRSRTTLNRAWFSGSPPKAESSSSSSSLSPSSPVSTLLFAPPAHDMGMWFTYGKPPVKKQKKRPAQMVDGETGFNTPVQRRCSHCQVTKTPQWRAGPNGPKTLCNACGVRYKSGRLFPEYRPACSPTFSSEVHSNSHRKVLEMRRKKEVDEPVTGPAQLVSSC